ncbi:MAG: NUDIX hydrolase [Clostridiales bacterium]|nr:NUDIX hydrolase [Clostridiales bacterium]
MKLKESKKDGKYYFNGKVFNVKVDDVILPDGALSKREIVEHDGGATALVVKNGKILFVKQFRYAFNKVVMELPAGKLNKGEKPLDTAIRELKEECGIIPIKIEKLFEIYPTPGYTTEKIFIYEVKEFKRSKKALDEGEFLNVCWIKEEKVREYLKNGKIKDGKTVIALLNYFLTKTEKIDGENI